MTKKQVQAIKDLSARVAEVRKLLGECASFVDEIDEVLGEEGIS